MSKMIMIVDDSPSMRQAVGIALKSAGYQVVDACNGADALDKLGHQKIHLVVCDVNMPQMDGIAFVRELKLCPNHRFTPVIMLTTETQEAKKREAQAAGAKAWVVKPFRPEVLVAAVQKLVLP